MNKSLEKISRLIQNQNFDEAITHLIELLKIEDKNWNAWYLLGQVYRYLGNLEKSVDCHKIAIKLNPDNPPVLLALGISYQLNKKYNEAIEKFEQAIKLDDTYIHAYNSLALSYKRINNLDKSQKIYTDGMNATAKKFFISAENIKSNKIYKYKNTVGTTWIQSAIYGATFIAAKLGFESILFPTSQSAQTEEKTEEHKGLYWIEKKGKVFEVLPNLFNAYRESLISNQLFITMLRDQGLVLDLLGHSKEVQANFAEADFFDQ